MSKHLLLVILLLAATVAALTTSGTTAGIVSPYPIHYYRFENSSNLAQDSGSRGAPLRIPSNPKISQQTADGIVGGYLFSGINSTISAISPEGGDGWSMEFLFKTLDSGEILGHGGGIRMAVGLWMELAIPWNAVCIEWEANGIGSKALNYFTFGWHHCAVTVEPFDHKKHDKKKTVNQTVTLCFDGNICSNGTLKWTMKAMDSFIIGAPYESKYRNGLAVDEVAIYNTTLEPQVIWAHANNALKQHLPYNFNAPIPDTPVPPPVEPSKNYNLLDFAPGSQLPTPPGKNTQGVNVSALDQLRLFPDPQFPSDPKIVALFERNFDWMSPGYMGFINQKRNTTMSNEIQKLLYSKYYYGIVFSNLRSCCSSEEEETITEMVTAFGTDVVFDAIILRLQTAGGTVLYNHTLPDACYLQDASGQFLNGDGYPVKEKSQAYLRVVTEEVAQEVGCPGSMFYHDGLAFNTSLQTLQKLLQKYGANIARVNNDGEAMNILGAGILNDPMVNKSYTQWCTTEKRCNNFLTFWSLWRTRMSDPTFRHLFMPYLPSSSRYTQYQIQGTTPYFGNWTVTRTIMDKLKNNQYYSCSDFYPTDPATVFGSRGPWHGMDWMHEVRASELNSGNPFFSPFIAAGWAAATETHVRPAQWLGIMKLFGVWGAEFYYSGYFSLASPFPPPENWIWQAAIPSYAQAITMQYADIFFNGTFAGFQETGILNVWCATRRGGGTGSATTSSSSTTTSTWVDYILVCTIQRNNNFIGAVPDTVENVPISIAGYEIEGVTARVQGSVYRITLPVTTTEEGKKRPSSSFSTASASAAGVKMVQLDAWHESTHPWYWKR